MDLNTGQGTLNSQFGFCSQGKLVHYSHSHREPWAEAAFRPTSGKGVGA